jgi:hypothetical protein
MGKSSLMVSTANHLRAEGARVAVVDLTGIGINLTVQQWYLGFLRRVGRELNLEQELQEHWSGNESAGALDRMMEAIFAILLDRPGGPIVIFIDEIDVAKTLPFSLDEFFVAIREIYTRRAVDSRYNRLIFCLLGVATPAELIGDIRVTPFNIGRRIVLQDFTLDEALALAAGLGRPPADAEMLLRRIVW